MIQLGITYFRVKVNTIQFNCATYVNTIVFSLWLLLTSIITQQIAIRLGNNFCRENPHKVSTLTYSRALAKYPSVWRLRHTVALSLAWRDNDKCVKFRSTSFQVSHNNNYQLRSMSMSKLQQQESLLTCFALN